MQKPQKHKPIFLYDSSKTRGGRSASSISTMIKKTEACLIGF